MTGSWLSYLSLELGELLGKERELGVVGDRSGIQQVADLGRGTAEASRHDRDQLVETRAAREAQVLREPDGGGVTKVPGGVVAVACPAVEPSSSHRRLDRLDRDRQWFDHERPEAATSPDHHRQEGEADRDRGRAQTGRQDRAQRAGVARWYVGRVGDVPDQVSVPAGKPESYRRLVTLRELPVGEELGRTDEVGAGSAADARHQTRS